MTTSTPREPQPAGPVLRPLVWSALLGVIVSAAVARPVSADPSRPHTVPDTGIRPIPNGSVRLPDATAPRATPRVLPPITTGAATSIQARIAAAQTEVATLGQQLLKAREELAAARTEEASATAKHQAARAARIAADRVAETAAADVLKRAAALPPGVFNSDLHEFGALARIQRGRPEPADTDAAVRAAVRARAAEEAARQAHEEARERVTSLSARYDELKAKYQRAEDDLAKLEKKHADEKTRLEQQREAREQAIGEDIIRHTSVAGKRAHPKALAALAFALKQRGKPYVWAAEGPDAYDCSGLVWAAYRSVGYRKLPRVANDQYYATRHNRVDRAALLPGDLIFFASGPHWQSIHHVGMYVGDGKMVHAPSSGDVVKVSAVWWSRFYAATRIFPAVDVTPPTPSPTPTPSASPTPSPTSNPTSSPTSSPAQPQPTVPPTTPPTARPTPSASPTSRPTPLPTALPSPSGTSAPPLSPSPPSSGAPTSAAPPSTPTPTSTRSGTPSSGPSGSPSAGRPR